MPRSIPLALALLLLVGWATEAPAQDAAPLVVSASRVHTSAPLRDLPIRPGAHRTLPPYEIPNRFHRFDRQPLPEAPAGFVDPVLDAGLSEGGGGTVLRSFDGYSENDNIAVAQVVVPPDANGDVGPNHYVQWVNLGAKIFNKNGNLLLGPVPGNHFFQGLGGRCETENDGDPVALYDPLADRWVVMQFQISSGYDLCVAVSETPDPTGAYHQYEFSFVNFPDYPKLGVWPDAYYATVRSFAGGFVGQQAIAFERARMLQGLSARMVVFDIPGGSATDGFIPVDLDGPAPPAGTPGLFVGSPTLSPQQLRLYGLAVNWTNTSASTLTLLRTLTPAAFDGSFGNVLQPSPGESLATLSFTLMHRVQYRNFGDRQALLLNHSVDAGGDRAGIRWYELRNTGGGWNIHQQGTFAPSDGRERWMGSVAMNGAGDIGLAYSVSSTNTFPSLRFTGQTADQSGTGLMNVDETEIHAGTGAQINSFNRWGDYSMLAVDPSDDATFWFTSEYYQTTSSFNFRTRIGAFQLPGAGGAVTLDATNTSPLSVPAGGSVSFDYTITNGTASSATLDLYFTASPFNRRGLIRTVTLGAGQSVSGSFVQNVPGNAPPRDYTYTLHVGTFPNTSLASEVFTVTVLPPAAAAAPGDGEWTVSGVTAPETAEPVRAASRVREAVLEAARPNPFFSATTLSFTLPAATDARLAVYDMLGRRVAVLHDGFADAGRHTVAFDGSRLPSGAYVARLTTAGGATLTQPLSLLR
jgi:hypothetical protein